MFTSVFSRDHVLTARCPIYHSHTCTHTHPRTYHAHKEDFALDDGEFQNAISILKLLALGAHQVCRACMSHLSLMMYVRLFPSYFFLLFLFRSLALGTHVHTSLPRYAV